MTIVKWDPGTERALIQERVNRMFEDAFPCRNDLEEVANACVWTPSVDIYPGKSGIVVEVDLPGVKKEDITVEVKGRTLSFRGERSAASPENGTGYFRRERVCGSFHRTFRMPVTMDPGDVKAFFSDGVLHIEIKDPPAEKPKKVSVAQAGK